MKLIFPLLLSIITLNSVLSQIKMDVWSGGKNTSKTVSTPVQAKNLPKVFESKMPDGTTVIYEKFERGPLTVNTKSGNKFVTQPVVYRSKNSISVVTYTDKGWMGTYQSKTGKSYSMTYNTTQEVKQTNFTGNCNTIRTTLSQKDIPQPDVKSPRPTSKTVNQDDWSRMDFYDSSKVIPYTCSLYVEIAYDVYQKFYTQNPNNTIQDVTNFYTQMYEGVSYLFSREGITLNMYQLYIWNSMDLVGYTNTNGHGGLLPIVRFKNENNSSNPVPTSCYFRQLVVGWQGWVGQVGVGELINGGNGYELLTGFGVAQHSVIRMDNFYNIPSNPPTIGFIPMIVAAHEIGHNLGSEHTHNCGFWKTEEGEPRARLDSCATFEGTCNNSPSEGQLKIPQDPKIPSIMSYCNYNDTLRNLSVTNGFNRLPRWGIRANLYYTFVNASSYTTSRLDAVFSITLNRAIARYTISNPDNLPFDVSERGVVWSTQVKPTINSNKIVDNILTSGVSELPLDGLSPYTTYYVRGYFRKISGEIVYTNQIKFTTTNLPTLVPRNSGTLKPDQETRWQNRWTFDGYLTGNGGSYITDIGFCYTTNPNILPTYESSNKRSCNRYNNGSVQAPEALPATLSAINSIDFFYDTDIGGISQYSIPVYGTVGLNSSIFQPNTTYYIRHFAVNANGVGYSDLITYTSPPIATTVLRIVAEDVSPTSITTNYTSDFFTSGNLQLYFSSTTTNSSAYLPPIPNPWKIIEAGVLYSTSPNDTLNDITSQQKVLVPQQVVSSEFVTSNYNLIIPNLLPNTIYYFKFYLKTQNNQLIFSEKTTDTTLADFEIPIVITGKLTNNGEYFWQISRYCQQNPNIFDGECGTYLYRKGGKPLTEIGYVISTSPTPTYGIDTKIPQSLASGKFWGSRDLTGYNDGNFFVTSGPTSTTYYIRAFAKNEIGLGYGQIRSFTQWNSPSTQTKAVTYINQNLIRSGGIVGNIGIDMYQEVPGNPVILRGVLWIKNKPIQGGLLVNSQNYEGIVTNGPGVGSYDSDIPVANDPVGTTYQIRAFSKTANGWRYGTQFLFTKPNTRLRVITKDSSFVSPTNARVFGVAGLPGDSNSILNVGFIWSNQTQYPNLINRTGIKSISSGFQFGKRFELTIDPLVPNTTYWVRAYASNQYGVALGEPIQITTPQTVSVPVVFTKGISNSNANTAESGGIISYTGNLTITKVGLVWSTGGTPLYSVNNPNQTSDNISNDFSTTLTGLTPNTTYSYRAYAINSQGVGYGELRQFTTQSGIPPTVVTNVPLPGSQIEDCSGPGACPVTAIGEVISSGSGNFVNKGFIWSNLPNPTITSYTGKLDVFDGFQTGQMKKGLCCYGDINLLPNTTYYLKAFATNSIGTSYGEEKTFIFPYLSNIIVNTSNTFPTTPYSINSGGNIILGGTSQIIQRGVCWSQTPNPTINNSKTINGSGLGLFTSSILGLKPNTQYYIRAYAKNSTDIGYGNQTIVSTPSIGNGDCSININVNNILGWAFDFNTNFNCQSYTVTLSAYKKSPIDFPGLLPEATVTLNSMNGYIPTTTEFTDNQITRVMKPQPTGMIKVDPIIGKWFGLSVKCNGNCVGSNTSVKYFRVVAP